MPINNIMTNNTTCDNEPIVYRSGVVSTIFFLALSGFCLYIFGPWFFEIVHSGTRLADKVGVFIGLVALSIAFLVQLRDLLFGVRRVEIDGTTFTVRYTFTSLLCDLSQLQELSIKQIQIKNKIGIQFLYRLTFLDPDLKRHYFALTGEQGAKIVLRLAPYVHRDNLHIQSNSTL